MKSSARVTAFAAVLFALTAITAQPQSAREQSARTEDVRRRRNRPPEKNFFFMIKQLTLVGYYTSQIGFEQELHGEIVPSRHAGCVPLEEEASK